MAIMVFREPATIFLQRVRPLIYYNVGRGPIGDSRIAALDEAAGTVTFTWKDRASHDRIRREAIPGTGFVERYLRHVLPRGMRSIRYFGFLHPAAKEKRERVAFHSGLALRVGPPPEPPPPAAPPRFRRTTRTHKTAVTPSGGSAPPRPHVAVR